MKAQIFAHGRSAALRAAGRFGFALLAVFMLLAVAWGQSGKRLILKDGTWQGVSEYKMEGDRVRYLSSERGEWEELPKDLVDWKATDEWNAGVHPRSSEEKDSILAEAENERRAMEAETPLVAPGLRLPYEGGVFLLDQYQGKPELVAITQNSAEVNEASGGRGILRSTINPLAVQKQTLELKNAHAKVQAHVAAPEIYVALPPDFSYGTPVADRFRILRLEAKKNSRTVQSIKTSMTGKVSQQSRLVPVRVEKFSGEWRKVIFSEGLQPGEYALVEMLTRDEMNYYVWDFGMDANAPENANQVKPETEKPDAEPVLQPGRK